jgi:indole-3-glycerol phosphate synthase
MVLDQILKHKKKKLERLKKKVPLAKRIEQAFTYKGVRRSLKKSLAQGQKTHLICELKKASPSEGLLRKNFRVRELARQFEAAGASALSVLTEERYFLGNSRFLKQIRAVTHIPILRKDFIFDPYQVYETLLLGADAFLIIVHQVSDDQLKDLLKIAKRLKLEALVEVHTKKELDRAIKAGSEVIGVNNRNLKTLKIDLTVAEKLIPYIPKGVVVVVESGIETRKDIERYQRLGVSSFLIGTSFMKSKNLRQKMLELKAN